MRKKVWMLAWIGVGVWTLLALIGWGALGIFGAIACDLLGYVPGFPIEPLSLAGLAEFLRQLGVASLFLIWLLGASIILSISALVGRFLPGNRVPVFLPGRKRR